MSAQASNMNYALHISCMVEEKLALIQRPFDWTQADEAQAYERCLKEALEDNGRAWADGNIRVGDYILLIDSDTRVPVDCLLDACSEMEQSPEVGIMQFSSGVMQVVHTYFENGITFFTNLIYTAIRYTVSNGDVAPFVGHNAILRWSAIQHVSYEDEDGYEKFWSESHVSEDFDMSLRLQVNGYTIRLAAWAGEGFKEGVSLTVYDELARWEKYAYGCNELLFHPLRKWIYRGPFTPLFRSFLFSNIRFTSKVTIISYIGTYYAIGAAWIMTTANYFAVGWFNGYLDKYYVDSWKVWFSIVIVFNGLGNIALAVMRYRIGERSLMYSIFENFKWTFMLAIFLGGLSLHVSQALLSHMFEIDMTWGATSKEAEFSNFFIEVPKVLKRFKFSMIFSLIGIIGMIVLATGSFVPYDWRINDFVAILPMATVTVSHLLLPLALNPALMTFSW
ncbi:glycosyltransferase family 2 protein [Rutstroemia sp. NJR-2017a WRK4]|nr:glycosyltransferase family 2 protein [Rutstroemia sp. NJR-2017a WRK4]